MHNPGLSFPFLPIAWIGGLCFVWAMGTEKVYLFGAFIAILLQTWLVMINWQNTRQKEWINSKLLWTGIDGKDVDEIIRTNDNNAMQRITGKSGSR